MRYLKYSLYFVAAVYAVNFFFLGFLIGPFDYNHLSGYYELAWRFWTTGSGLPQYNPYLCGGRTLGADPQLPIFNPLVALVPVLGATLLIKWEMLAQLVLGTFGLWKWLEELEVSREGRVWGVFLFVSGGAIVSRFLVGHVTLGFYSLYPLFFYLSERLSGPEPRHKIRAIYWLLFIYSGLYKPNFLIYAVPPLFIEAFARSVFRKNFRPLAELTAATVVSGLACAVCLLPAWKYFHDYPRTDASGAQLVAWYAFFANLLMPLKSIPKAWYGPGFLMRHEYNIYVGPVALVFAWWGLRKGWKEKHRASFAALAVLLVFSAWIGIGSPTHDFTLFFPYTWFHHLWPGFKSVRVPTRFWFGVYLALVVFSAKGFRAPRTRTMTALFVLLGLLPLVAGATANLFKTTVEAKETQWTVPRAYADDIVLVEKHPDDQYEYLRQGMANINCTDNIEVHRPRDLSPGRMLGVVLSSKDGVLALDRTERIEARWLGWNRFRVTAHGAGPFTAAFDMNHSPLWRIQGKGRIVSKFGERLTVASDGNVIDAELIFEQPLVLPALILSLITSAAVAGYLFFAFKRRA